MQGEVAYLYAFDVASEIETAKVQEILANKPVPFELRADRTYPKDVPIYKPLGIEPPPPGTMGGRPVRVLIRIYEVGVVSVVMRVAFDVEKLAALLPLHKPAFDTGQAFDQLARNLCLEVCKSLSAALLGSSPPTNPEAYTVFCLTAIDRLTDANQWLDQNRREVAGLLSEMGPDSLSDPQVVEVLRIRQSMEKSDVVVIDWDAALVVDLTGYIDDVLYVLELANLQLEEFRMMDQKLDRYLNRAYEDLDRRSYGLFGITSPVLHTLRLFRVDLTKLSDEVTHIGKFFGDWYLARVYVGARERFHLGPWRHSVEERLGQLDTLYTVVETEINNKKMFWLEVIIVVFFAIDIVALLFFRK